MTYRWQFSTINSPKDQTEIRYAVAQKPGAEVDRYVVMVNGRTEWIEKYDFLPDRLSLPDSCGFVSWDHRGQGASGGRRAWVEAYDDYVIDGARVLEEAVGSKPYVIMAHSMGALISVIGGLSRQFTPQAIALSGPLFGLPRLGFHPTLNRSISNALTVFKMGGISSGAGQHHKIAFQRNKLTHSYEMFQKIRKSPYMIPSATFGWISATFDALDVIYDSQKLKGLSVPVLVLAGSDDIAVDPTGFSRWVTTANQFSKATVQLAILPGAKHELFAESPPFIDQALGQVRQWFSPFLKA